MLRRRKAEGYGIEVKLEKDEPGENRTCLCCGGRYQSAFIGAFLYTITPGGSWQRFGGNSICGSCLKRGESAIREGLRFHAQWFTAQAEASVTVPPFEAWIRLEGEEEKLLLADWLAKHGQDATQAGVH